MSLTAVTLGSFFTTSNGKTVLGGAGGSGLDTQALITQLMTAHNEPITQDQTEIKANNAQSTALTTFQNLLTTFQTAAQALSNPPGVSNTANNVFDFTTGSVGNGGSAYVSVTTSPGAALQTYNISNISSIASSANQSSGTFNVASANADATVNPGGGAAYFTPGTITFASGATVTVNSGDSLNTIAANFNAVSAQTGINATVVQVDGTHYQLSFTATATGTDGNFDLTDNAFTSDPTDYPGPPTVSSGGSVLTTIGLQAANEGTNAIFEIDNIPVTRQTNNISDVINGVTFNILQQTPNGTTEYPVTISPDTTTIQNTINNFVNAYNAIQTFAAQQTQLNSSGTYASSAVLATNQTFRQTMADIDSDVVAEVGGLASGDLNSLGALGITFTNQPASGTNPPVSNILTVNDGQLTSALSSNFQQVQNLFGYNFTANNPNVALFAANQPLGVTSFTLDASGVTSSGGTFTATFDPSLNLSPVTLTATALPGGGGFDLTGPDGSVLAGLQLIYASTSDSTTSVGLTQGIAAQAYNSTNAATTANTGTIATALTALQTSNTSLNNSITQLTTQANQYQQQLLNEFAALEQAISSTNSLLQSINANQNAALVQAGQ